MQSALCQIGSSPRTDDGCLFQREPGDFLEDLGQLPSDRGEAFGKFALVARIEAMRDLIEVGAL
jgi:hypothetical protein